MYNRADFIGEAVDSILAQTFTDFEIVVVDDGSTDNSRELVQAYTDARVHMVCNGENRGLSASRNHGISVAQGEYVAFLDSDDRATSDRLEHQVAFLDANPDIAAVGAWMRWINADGSDTGKTKRKAGSSDQIAAEMLFRAGLEVSASTARTDIMRAIPHREEFVRGSDYDLWARVGAKHKLATLPRVLLERRLHPGQSTFGKKSPESQRSRLRVSSELLDHLGIEYSAEDLERHCLLRRMHKANYWPSADYLSWAEQWLLALQSANRDRHLYPEPAFSGVLGTFWAKTCWRALRGTGPKALWRFLRSPLRATVWSGLRTEAQTRLRLDFMNRAESD